MTHHTIEVMAVMDAIYMFNARASNSSKECSTIPMEIKIDQHSARMIDFVDDALLANNGINTKFDIIFMIMGSMRHFNWALI